ncbi:hypothetical protein Q6346_01435 [Isoptericola sp. b490]|uniref:lysylphosphatidylglycerol synthase domain-containing protein n=1 Tax=Actinotalea lenta TaxID=3064654 RepID=UPI00271409A3|nr:lysylphosphatidylglycerol synthase domain-containing protein [Isoptericola sp. b490]MDO8119973.1 hypothetical protein [Isoptericola sp. b490]
MSAAQQPPARRSVRSVVGVLVRWGALLAALVLAGVAVHGRWPEVRGHLADLGWPAVTVAVLAAMAAVASSGEQQRALLAATGANIRPRPWASVFYLAQLGKYLPGSAWAYVAQTELARQRGVRRSASVMVIVLGAGMTVATAVVVAVPAVATGRFSDVPAWLQWSVVAVGAAAVAVLAVRPELLADLLARLPLGFRGLRLPALARHRGPVRTALGWSFVAWLLYGLHFWSIVAPLGLTGARGAVMALGTFALAWVCGFLFFIAPAGAYVREAVIYAVLVGEIGASAATAAALASRFLVMVAELILTGVGALLRGRGGAPASQVDAVDGPTEGTDRSAT